MAKFYIISPSGVPLNPVLFPTMKPHFYAAGHTFTANLEDADCFLIDLHTRIAGYDQSVLDEVAVIGKGIVSFCEFDFGGMAKDSWPHYTKQQQEFFDKAEGNGSKLIHFVRKMDRTKTYPSNILPYELCIMHDEPLVSKEELFNREYDFCFAGNKSPQRVNTVNGLLNSGFKGLVYWTTDNPKLPHNEWLDLHRQAKLFLSVDGGGFTDERAQQLFSISAQLKQRNNHLQANPFSDCVNCIFVDENPTKTDITAVRKVIDNEEYLYEIYEDGYKHIKTYYSEHYMVNYTISKLKQIGIV